MTLYVAPVVEGLTEQGCVERLLQGIWSKLLGCSERLQVLEPRRKPRSSLVHTDGRVLIEAVQAASLVLDRKTARDAEGRSLLLILLDAEDDCPATLAPRLLQTARTALPAGMNVACVLAVRMLENWIVGGASSLAGVNGLPDPLPPRDRYEVIHGAGWLGQQLRSHNSRRKYKKTADAEPFVRSMSLEECRGNCPSFDKLCRELHKSLPSAPRQEIPPDHGGDVARPDDTPS